MLYYQIIDVSERNDVNKTSSSKGFDICYYWWFLDKGFNFQPYLSNECHGLLLCCYYSVGYCFNINQISKSDVVNLLKNADMTM